MPKKQPAATPEANAPPADLPDWKSLPEGALELAADGDIEALTRLLVDAGLGARPQAEFLILAVEAERKYRPVAAELDQRREEHAASERHLQALKNFHPEGVADVREYAETRHQVERETAKLTLAVGEAEQAACHIAWLDWYFTTNTTAICPRNGSPPSELHGWFREHERDKWEPGSWIATSPASNEPRRFVITAGVNVGGAK